MKSYYLPDELFSIVKQFAGIYNMRTTISKMDKDYVEKARYYLNSKHHQRFNVVVDGVNLSRFDKKKKDTTLVYTVVFKDASLSIKDRRTSKNRMAEWLGYRLQSDKIKINEIASSVTTPVDSVKLKSGTDQ